MKKGISLEISPTPSLITLFCIKGGVKFDKQEDERYPKASPLTLAGVLKALVESEEGEKREKPTKKRKRVETTENRDQASTATFGEGDSSEGGGFEANLEQSMLSSTINHGIPTQTEEIEKEKVKQREAQVLSNCLHRGKGVKERGELLLKIATT